jgi:hypothetical protein
LQLQLPIEEDPAGEFMFWGQASSPPPMQYLPGLHGWQAWYPLPLVPFTHRHALAFALCGGLCCAAPPGHPAMCPPPRQKLSAGHGLHICTSVCTVVL